jgi:PST family polysaccharide transporter
LARLLSPDDFGLLGMVSVFTGFVYLLGELGFGAGIIQNEKIEQSHLSMVFWINIIFGLILAFLLYLSSESIAKFYNEAELISILRLISINIFIMPLGMVQNAIQVRLMNFKKLGIIELISILISGVIAVILTKMGFGVYSLVWQIISVNIINVSLLWITSDWRPKVEWDYRALKSIIKFSGNLLGFNIMNYWVRNGDNLLVGKFFGPIELGIYSRAYSLMLLPVTQITSVLSKVMFPSLSRLQNDIKKFKRIYFQTISLIAFITFPMMLGLFVVSFELVDVVLSPKWLPIVDFLKIFSIVGLIQSILSTVGWIYQGLGKTHIMFKWGLYSSFITILSFIIGITLGSSKYLAISYTIANFIFLFFPGFAIPLKLINSTVWELILNLKSIIFNSVIMFVFLIIIKNQFLYNFSSFWKLVSCVLLGCTFYIACNWISQEKTFLLLGNLFFHFFKRKVTVEL